MPAARGGRFYFRSFFSTGSWSSRSASARARRANASLWRTRSFSSRTSAEDVRVGCVRAPFEDLEHAPREGVLVSTAKSPPVLHER